MARYKSIQERWAEVNQLKAQLLEKGFDPESVYVVGIEAAGLEVKDGPMFEVTAARAAKLITEQTHRLASPEEIKQYHRQQKAEAKRIKKQDFESKTKLVLHSSPPRATEPPEAETQPEPAADVG